MRLCRHLNSACSHRSEKLWSFVGPCVQHAEQQASRIFICPDWGRRVIFLGFYLNSDFILKHLDLSYCVWAAQKFSQSLKSNDWKYRWFSSFFWVLCFRLWPYFKLWNSFRKWPRLVQTGLLCSCTTRKTLLGLWLWKWFSVMYNNELWSVVRLRISWRLYFKLNRCRL